MPIQCKKTNYSQCCRCCDQNSISSPNEKEYMFGDRYIYYYLAKGPCGCQKLTQQEIKEIAENYLRIVNEADDTVKTLDEVTTEKLTSEIIIQYLKIDKAINEINNINDVKQKIIRIISIVNDDFINKRYTYEDSTLKLPRCLVEHENNNCVLESYFTAMLSNPYRIKLFYLLNYLFENGFLSKENYPVTFEVCKFFNEAVNHPTFTDTIRCISVMKAYFDNYSDSNYAQQKDKNGNLMYAYGSFQNYDFVCEIRMCVVNELNTGQGLQQYMSLLEKNIFSKVNIHGGGLDRDSECNLCYFPTDIATLDKLNYSGYKYNDNFIHFTSITFAAHGFHFYTFRKINNIWINYDSYKVKTPTPVSDKFISRLILNSIIWIPNFNGHYSEYDTTINEHYDSF